MDTYAHAVAGPAPAEGVLADLERDVNEREERLTSLCQVLGFPSLDHLEDFVLLHGAVKVVPSGEARSLPLDETQGVSQWSETVHARRHQERRVENARLKAENERVKGEIEWARTEREKDKDHAEQLTKDKSRLLDRVEELRRENELLKLAAATGDGASTSGGGSSMSTERDTSRASEVAGLHDDVADLEAQVGHLEQQLEAARLKCDEQAVDLREAQGEVRTLLGEKAKLEKELDKAKRKLKQVETAFRATFEADASQPSQPSQPQQQPGSSTTLAQEASPRSTRSPPLTRPLASQVRGPSAPFQPSPRTNNRSSLAPPSVAPSPAVAKPAGTLQPAKPAASAGPSSEGEVSRDVTPTPASAKPPTLPAPAAEASTSGPVSTAAPSASIPPPRPTAIPPYLQAKAAASPAGSSTPRAASPDQPPAASPAAPATPTSTAGLLPADIRRYKLWPKLLVSYNERRAALAPSIARFQAAHRQLDALSASEAERIRDRVGGTPSLVCPADFEPGGRLEAEPFLPPPEQADERRAWAADGRLEKVYERTAKGEHDMENLAEGLGFWCANVEKLCERLERKREKQKAEAVGGAAKVVPAKRALLAGEAVATSSPASLVSSTKGTPRGEPVKKRRRVVKPATGNATPAPATGPLPSTSSTTATPQPPARPSPVKPVAHTPRTSQAPLPAAALPSSGVVAVTDTSAVTVTSALASSAKGKKRWNLASPTKKNAASPLAVLKSPGRSPGGSKRRNINLNHPSPKKPSVLVEDTQLPSPARPLPAVSAAQVLPQPAPPPAFTRRSSSDTPFRSDSTSTYEPEPDTLVTERAASQSSATVRARSSSRPPFGGAAARSSSRSPVKRPPRRSSSVAPALDRVPESSPIFPLALGAQAKGEAPAIQAREDDDGKMADDPFDSRPAPMPPAGAKEKSPFALRPSPNFRSAKRASPFPARSDPSLSPPPSPSPAGSPSKSLGDYEMPPSAQPVRRLASRTAAELAEQEEDPLSSPPPRFSSAKAKGKQRMLEDEEDSEDEEDVRTELRLFNGLGTPPFSTPERRDKRKKTVVKQEETQQTKPKGKKRKKRAQDDDEDEDLAAAVKDEPLSQPDLPAIVDSPPRSGAKSMKAKKARRLGEGVPERSHSNINRDDLPSDLEPFPQGSQVGTQERAAWVRRNVTEKRIEKGKAERAKKVAEKGSSARPIEVNPERNNGEKHLYKAVVRNKEQRAKMLAEECPSCASYYKRAGRPMPVNSGPCEHQRVAARNGGSPAVGGKAQHYLDMRARDQQSRMQDVGRHRVQQPTNAEPPDYWQMGMPNTQQTADINGRAQKQNAEQRAFKEAQAQQADGLYRYRDE
ncbi:hypothetical protein JCM10213_001334 [Rhodosporidiobolus nylandii]